MSIEIHGFANPGFEPIREAFEKNFALGLEQGASVAVTRDGEFVVDLWAGEADGTGRAWERDTIVNVYSTTKTMAAMSVLVLADRNEIDLAAPVATYWPEFAKNGKEGVTISHVMSHSAGLSGFEPALESHELLYDWDLCCERLANQSPWWEPGSASGYHAITQGYLQGEIVRRVTGQTIGQFFRSEIAAPLGADFWIGLPASEDARVADLVPPEFGAAGDSTAPEDSLPHRTMSSVPITGHEPRDREWRGAEIPAAGGTGNARSVGRIHSALACGGEVDGVRILSQAGVERILEEQTIGTDLVMGAPLRFGQGFGLIHPDVPMSPSERAFYWGGWGGSIAMTDLDLRATITYVMNRMESNLLGDKRGARILHAAYGALLAGG
ncbi:MAG: serine hydrolase [Deltaproteobacteria bacterium]|nr:serine hydrolase [Deltaproteobacteria bacterium]